MRDLHVFECLSFVGKRGGLALSVWEETRDGGVGFVICLVECLSVCLSACSWVMSCGKGLSIMKEKNYGLGRFVPWT